MSAATVRRGWVLDVANLAALDMSAFGRRLIISEFAVGVGGCLVLGAISLRSGLIGLSYGPSWPVWLGLELLAVGLNYVPLLLLAVQASRDGELMARAARLLKEQPTVARRFGILQAWILVPLAVVIFALAQRSEVAPQGAARPGRANDGY